MNKSMVVVTNIGLDREVMSIRTWWVMDQRVAGNPLSVYLYFRALGDGASVTQTQAMEDLGLAKTAFRAAKLRLRRAGFLLEIRDRYPSDYRDPRTGEPRGGQKRFQLRLLDPAEGAVVNDEFSLIEADVPFEAVVPRRVV